MAAENMKKNGADPDAARPAKPVKHKAGTASSDADAAVTSGVKFSLRIKFAIAIISLVVLIIITMSIYVIWHESGVLEKEILTLARREIDHMQTTAADALSTESELQLLAITEDMKGLESIKYAYILDADNRIRQNLIPEKNGTVLDDDITRALKNYTELREPLRHTLPDPEGGGLIYDFSKPLVEKLGKKRIGSVRLGFSDGIIRKEIRSMAQNIILIALLFIGVSVVGAVALASFIIKPIRQLSEGAAIIGTGKLDYKITVSSSDEIGQLANEFNAMTEHLRKARDIEIEQRIMQEQLDLAKEIQEGLNPMAFYDKTGVQIKGYTKAAKGVGGDYFDYVDIDEHRVGALLSDVSGKGIPASLVMVMIRTVFVTYIHRKDISTASVVRAINDSLSADFAIDKFATLFFLIYDRRTRELTFTNAGHGPLFCYRASMGACTITKLDGMPIGITEDVDYQQARVKLNPGDIVVMYSDGVTEMRNEKRDEYGRARLQKLIIDNNERNANDIVEAIVADVNDFRGNASPHDDMTTLVLKVV